MALPLQERIALADLLEQSLRAEIPREVSADKGTNSDEFLAEFNRRLDEYLKDPSTAVSGDEVIAEMRRRQAADC